VDGSLHTAIVGEQHESAKCIYQKQSCCLSRLRCNSRAGVDCSMLVSQDKPVHIYIVANWSRRWRI